MDFVLTTKFWSSVLHNITGMVSKEIILDKE